MSAFSSASSRLRAPDTTVQELPGERALVTLGPWPEAGDMATGQVLPFYRELARVLELWLFFEKPRPGADFSPEELHRRERRIIG